MRRVNKKKWTFLLMMNAVLIVVLIVCINVLKDSTAAVAIRNQVPDSTFYTSEPKDEPAERNNSPETNQSPDSTPINRQDPSVTPMLSEKIETPVIVDTPVQQWLHYKALPYFKEENIERYIRYMDENPSLSHKKVIVHVNIGLDYGFYEHIRMVENGKDVTVLVNKYHKLPDSFKPNLVELKASMCAPGRGTQHLTKEAAEAFTRLHQDAKELGLNITAFGTYRSISIQHTIWNNAVNSGRTIEDVDSLNARGGHSEHHTGLAVDVIINDYSVLNTKEYDWYKDVVHEYGFIIRYPEGKEHITGYKYEPWHLRYVGLEIAAAVYSSGLTYDEYYVMFIEPYK